MKLYLMQHGEAQSSIQDPQEGLSKEGILQIENSAKALAQFNVQVDLIAHSPKKRSKMTAEILAKTLKGVSEVIETEKIKPKSSAEEAFEFLNNYREKRRVLIAGHLPSLQEICSFLLSNGTFSIEIKNGGCTRIDTHDLNKCSGRLIWHFLPEQLSFVSTSK